MMAYPQSPQGSPLVAHSIANKIDASASSAAPQPALSKRDKRRTVLSDKLNDLTASFSQNRDAHYRAQLVALQVDMQLIMRADPYRDAPLTDLGDDIDEMIASVIGSNIQSSNAIPGSQNSLRWADNDTANLSGKWYTQFAEDVNNAVEERDFQLTMLEEKHRRTLDEFEQINRYKIRLAQEEHAILCRTIKDRLVQSIVEKKKRLLKEKEQLDIADSNALLLHPSQFSMTNPASPGGLLSNRKTRNTRHRPGENEDLTNGILAVDNNKRKRKLALDDDIGSPGPSGLGIDGGTISPYRDGKAKLATAQFETPIYSIDKLFTEKELGLSLNIAATAAANFFAAEKANNNQNGSNANADTEMVDQTDDAAARVEREDTETLVAPELDRSANMSHHATRSTRKEAGASAALNILGDLAMTEKNGGFTAPVTLPSVITKTGLAPTPPPILLEQISEDLAKIDRLAASSPGSTDPKALKDLIDTPHRTARSREDGIADFAPAKIIANAAASIPMSAQSSIAGFNDVGGVAMRRDEGSSLGSAIMKRTASGAGLSFMSDAGKRVRNR